MSRPHSCRAFVERVSDQLDGELGPLGRLRFALHQASCPGCRRYAGQLRETVRLLGQLDRGGRESGSDDGKQVRSMKNQP